MRPDPDLTSAAAGAPGGALRRGWPVLLPILLVAVLLGPALIGQRSLSPLDELDRNWPWAAERSGADADTRRGPFSDVWDGALPTKSELSRRLRDGDLPLWTNTTAGGADLLPQLGHGTLAPSMSLWLVLPGWYVPGLLKALEILGAWGFVYLFLRRVGLQRSTASLGGLVFAVAGFQVVWIGWPHTLVNMFVAANLWSWDRVRESPRSPGRLAVASLTTAAAVLEGFPAVAITGLGAVAIVMVIRTVVERPDRRSALASATGVAAAATLGVGLTMVTVLPFAARLRLWELDRAVGGGRPAPRGLATVVSPNVLGPASDYFGPENYIEVVGYLAPAVLALIVGGLVVAVTRGRNGALTASVVTGGAVLLLYSYRIEPFFSGLRHLPVLSFNPPERLKATAAVLLAVGAGLAIDALVTATVGRRARVAALVAATTTTAVAIVVVVLTAADAPPSQSDFVRREAGRGVVMLLAGLVALAALLWRSRLRPRVGVAVVPAITALVLLDAIVWISGYWPQSSPDAYYPATAAHTFIHGHLGDDRMGTLHPTFRDNTNTAYGDRSMTAHTFQLPSWQEVVRAAGGFFERTTSAFLGPSSATSPLLDRFGVRYWADPPGYRRCTPSAERSRTIASLTPGTSVVTGEDGLRGATTVLASPVERDTDIVVTAGDRRGHTRILAGTPEGTEVYLGVPETDRPGDDPTRLTVTSIEGPPVVVRGEPLAPCVSRADDGLRLEFVDGANIYRRVGALPRVRWAGGAVVEPDGRRRLDLLAAGSLPADVVLLDEGAASPVPPGATGTAAVLEDDGDRQVHRTSSSAPGWLVITDSLQEGWRATVDGAAVDLVRAEHAGVAVAVPAGEHEVVVTYRPAGLRAGTAISLGSVGVVVALFAVAAARARRRIAAK